MNAEKKSYQDLLEQEISLFNALSDSFLTAKNAIVSLNLQEFEHLVAAQKILCGRIAANNAEIRRDHPLAGMQGGGEPSVLALQKTWREARARLQKLNFEHQVLLLRARHTVNAVLNGFRSFEGNYAVEAMQQGSHSFRERA